MPPPPKTPAPVPAAAPAPALTPAPALEMAVTVPEDLPLGAHFHTQLPDASAFQSGAWGGGGGGG